MTILKKGLQPNHHHPLLLVMGYIHLPHEHDPLALPVSWIGHSVAHSIPVRRLGRRTWMDGSTEWQRPGRTPTAVVNHFTFAGPWRFRLIRLDRTRNDPCTSNHIGFHPPLMLKVV